MKFLLRKKSVTRAIKAQSQTAQSQALAQSQQQQLRTCYGFMNK